MCMIVLFFIIIFLVHASFTTNDISGIYLGLNMVNLFCSGLLADIFSCIPSNILDRFLVICILYVNKQGREE